MRLLIISMLYVLCGSGLTAARNEIFFRKLGNPKEAYGDEVHQILIDRDGYAWIITTDRLLRFDGKNMKQYGGLKVERLAIDSYGVMYASGPNCLLRHDRMNDMFDSVPQWSAALNDNNGHLWLFDTRGGNCLVDGARVKVPAEPAAALLTRDGRFSYILDKKGRLWQAQRGKEPGKIDSIPMSVANGASLFQDREGNILFWDSFSPGIHRLAANGHETLMPGITVRSLDQDTDGCFHIASNDNGLLRASPDFKSVAPTPTTGLPSNHTSFIMTDREGRLWLGASWGAAMANPARIKVMRHRISKNIDISAIVEMPGDRLWLALDGDGIAEVSDGDRLSRHKSGSDGSAPWSKTTKLLPVDTNRLLALTYGDGVYLYDTRSDRVSKAEGGPDYAKAATASPLSSTYWIGSHMKGVYGFDKELDHIQHHTTEQGGLRTDFINDLCSTADDTIYIATGYGVYKFHAPDGTPRIAAPSLADISARCIASDTRGNVWIGTARGLLRYRPSTGKVSRVTSLGHECINSVATDSRGHLWALSPVGLHRIMAAPDGRLYTSAYLLGEDFPAINVTSMSMARGKIYLGGNGKYLELQLPAAHPEKPSRILLPDIPPGVESLTFDVGEAPRLRVATDNLSEAVPYIEYRLDNQHEWTEATDDTIPLDSLGTGSYTLSIRLAGNIEAPVKELGVEIRPVFPFGTKTTAAIIAVIAAAAVLVISLRKIAAGKNASLTSACDTHAQRNQPTPQVSVAPSPIKTSSQDERFLQRAREAVEQRMSDSDFGVDEFASQMCVSRSGLYKRLMSLTGLSPNEFIRQMRIKRGRDLLRADAGSIAEVAFMVGMTPRQFSKFYKDFFGVPPSMDSHGS